jgi:hypothetical protein
MPADTAVDAPLSIAGSTTPTKTSVKKTSNLSFV